MKLIAEATIQIQKTSEEVFEALVNPDKLTKYFLSESSGPMTEGKTLMWKFKEAPDRFPVKIEKIEPNKTIVFIWDTDIVVTIHLKSQSDKSTVIKVTENGKPLNEENLKWVIGNTEGWANFLACLKAYLEYGIQLRKGAFDFMIK